MSDSELRKKVDRTMLQLQDLLEEAELGEHPTIQSAFNALACALDDVVIEA